MVLNYAIVNQRNSISRYMRMRIRRGRLAVSRPPGMRDTAAPDNRIKRISVFKRFHFSRIFMQLERMVGIDQRHAR
jgi:hypothetical protein